MRTYLGSCGTAGSCPRGRKLVAAETRRFILQHDNTQSRTEQYSYGGYCVQKKDKSIIHQVFSSDHTIYISPGRGASRSPTFHPSGSAS